MVAALNLFYRESRSGGEICAGQEDDPWPSHEDEVIDFELVACQKDVSEMPGLQREQVQIDFDACPMIHVVLVRYRTGGTFGSTTGAWHIVGVYDSEGSAESIRKTIEDGTYVGWEPWKGYFEKLESAEVVSLKVGGWDPLADIKDLVERAYR